MDEVGLTPPHPLKPSLPEGRTQPFEDNTPEKKKTKTGLNMSSPPNRIFTMMRPGI
jgi:hypothetical protein